MRSLSLKYKLILAPAVIIIPVIFVIFLMLYYLNVIGQQNDSVRDWAHTTDQIRIAISSSTQLKTITKKLGNSQSSETEELLFNYIEQSRLLEGSVTNPILRDKVQGNTLDELQKISQEIKFNENMDIESVLSSLAVLTPMLEQLYNVLQAKKRAIYIDSNEYVKNKISTLANISVTVLALCVFLGIVLTLWITRSTTSKIRKLAKNANLVCDNNLQGSQQNKKIDELEDIALCLSMMSSRMLSTITTEKLLQGIEDERSRIAMDIHDQFLSDLTIFKRSLNQKFNNINTTPLCDADFNEINSTLDELAFTLRGIIDDLHPQTLNMFGLEAALQSYLDRKLCSEEHPDYYINIDHSIEDRLSLFQKLSLYRILLESIQNIIRHAHCSRYEIDLRIADDFLVLTVDDNGIGMKMDETTLKRGHGIFNITQRAYSINAEIHWNKSRFSSGTQVLLKLPTHFLSCEKTSSLDIKVSPHVQTV